MKVLHIACSIFSLLFSLFIKLMIAIAIRVLSLVRAWLPAPWGTAKTMPPSTFPPAAPSLLNYWWPWIGAQLLISLLSFMPFLATLTTKKMCGQVQPKKDHPAARKEEEEESGTDDISKSPSISFKLTPEKIRQSISLYKDKFKNMGIDIIGHEVLEYRGDLIGCGRYSYVYGVLRTWPGHRVNVPLCVKCITNKKPSAIFQTSIEVLNIAELTSVPGVPRVLAVCLTLPPLFVMTRHSRTTLDVMLRNCIVSDSFLLEVCHQLCVTLDIIHRRKKVHNDVKGNNICVDVKAGNHPKVTLIDYGLMTRVGERLFITPTCERDRRKAEMEHSIKYPWYDLDLYLGGPALPETDIYSVAVLLRQIMRVMDAPSAALQACVRDGLGNQRQRPPLTQFKEVLRASITTLNDRRQ